MPGAQALLAPGKRQDARARAVFIPKLLSVSRASQLGPGPGFHFQGWYFFLPLAGQGEVEKTHILWPLAPFELILLPLAGFATGVQATNTGHGRENSQVI